MQIQSHSWHGFLVRGQRRGYLWLDIDPISPDQASNKHFLSMSQVVGKVSAGSRAFCDGFRSEESQDAQKKLNPRCAILQTALAYARSWHHFDAKGETLGRLAVRMSLVLQGKHKPIYDPGSQFGRWSSRMQHQGWQLMVWDPIACSRLR
jgi:hypothetical protein